jgi:hypothetical protein
MIKIILSCHLVSVEDIRGFFYVIVAALYTRILEYIIRISTETQTILIQFSWFSSVLSAKSRDNTSIKWQPLSSKPIDFYSLVILPLGRYILKMAIMFTTRCEAHSLCIRI